MLVEKKLVYDSSLLLSLPYNHPGYISTVATPGLLEAAAAEGVARRCPSPTSPPTPTPTSSRCFFFYIPVAVELLLIGRCRLLRPGIRTRLDFSANFQQL